MDSSAAFDHCYDLVYRADRDRFLAALFAPAERRKHLLALYAFNIEIASTRERVSDPLPGEVRLQWWRDVLEGRGGDAARQHPVALALLETVATCSLPMKPLVDLIDARVFDLYDDPLPTIADLEGYAGETSSALMQLASLILAAGTDPQTGTAAGHAGVAYAVTGLIRAFAFHASRGQVFIPAEIMQRHGIDRDLILRGTVTPGISAALTDMRALALHHIDAVRDVIAEVSPDVVPAFLPVALARLYLARLDGILVDPFHAAVEVPQWRRQWVLWRSAVHARALARSRAKVLARRIAENHSAAARS